MDVGIAGKNTAIGDAIGLALKRLRQRPAQSRVLIVDRDNRVIASSDGAGLLTERLPAFGGSAAGWQLNDGRIVAQHATPGYETYRGLGWRGVIEQRLVADKPSATVTPLKRRR